MLSQARLQRGFQPETLGTEYYRNLDARYDNVHIVKDGISTFYAIDLEAVLLGHGTERLVLTHRLCRSVLCQGSP